MWVPVVDKNSDHMKGRRAELLVKARLGRFKA